VQITNVSLVFWYYEVEKFSKIKIKVVETGNYLGKDELFQLPRALYITSVQNKNMTLLLRIGSETQ